MRLTVLVTKYDDDWAFWVNNRKVGEGVEIMTEGETALECFNVFQKHTSVDGCWQKFGSDVPEGYRHVKRVREVMSQIKECLKKGTSYEDFSECCAFYHSTQTGFVLSLGGNWDVKFSFQDNRF